MLFWRFLDGFWAVLGGFKAVFDGFGGYIVVFIISIILSISTRQTGQFTNHRLSKFQKLPNCQPRSFWMVLGGFWAIFGNFGGYIVLFISPIISRIFTHQTGQFTNHGLSKFQKLPNHQPGGFWIVFGWFGQYLDSFWRFWQLYSVYSLHPKPHKTSQKPPKNCPKTARMVVWRFLKFL